MNKGLIPAKHMPDILGDGISYLEHYDFSEANMNDENRYKYIHYPIMKSLPTWADNDVSSKASVEKYYKKNEKILLFSNSDDYRYSRFFASHIK